MEIATFSSGVASFLLRRVEPSRLHHLDAHSLLINLALHTPVDLDEIVFLELRHTVLCRVRNASSFPEQPCNLTAHVAEIVIVNVGACYEFEEKLVTWLCLSAKKKQNRRNAPWCCRWHDARIYWPKATV